MINRLKNFRSKKYLLLFCVIMMLNVLLSAILLNVTLGQAKKEDFSSQKPIRVEIIEQKNSPLQITFLSVDNSAYLHQEIICSLQNVSNKTIRAYTLLGDGNRKNSGKIITSFFLERLFQVGGSVVDSVPMERRDLAEEDTVFLSIDYVEFEDGSFWGSDSVGKSKEIAGETAGAKQAIKQLKELIKNQNGNDADSITNFLKQNISEITVNVPETNESEEWKKGFTLGYRTVISILQRITDQKIENITKKLDDLENNFRKEGQTK